MKRFLYYVLCLQLAFSQAILTPTITLAESNTSGCIIDNYNVKDVEKEEKDSYQTYDKSGPQMENATVVTLGNSTNENIKESVNNDSVSADGGKYIITIDPGHSKVSTGASGNGIKEEEYTLEIGKILYSLLKQDSRFEVHMTRTDNRGVDNAKRPLISNKYNSDCFISIHLNSDSPAAHGTETLYNPQSEGKTSQGLECKQYAQIIQKYLQKATGFTDRGLSQRPELAVLRKGRNNAAAALAEIGFLSNASEAKALKKNKKKYAKGFYDAFVYIATKYPKPSEKSNITEASSSNLNASLANDVSLSNVAAATKVVKRGSYSDKDGKNYNGVYTIAGRKYKMYAQSKNTSAWCHSHGCSASVLATMLSSAGYDYTADQIHSADATKDYSIKAAIKAYGVKKGKNSDYAAYNRDMPMTCFGISCIMRNMGLSCDYVATWASDQDAIRDITAALAQGKCVAVYVKGVSRDGIQFTKKGGNHCILLVGFQDNGCLNFINPAGGRLNYSHITGKCNNLKLSNLVKYYMFKNSEKANQVVFNKSSRSGGYVKY